MNQEPGRPESSRPSTSLSRRRLLQLAGVAGLAAAAGPQLRHHPGASSQLAQARAEIGTRARPFDLGQVRLTASRWLDNQNRTLNYLRFVDVDRLLYNFRANHRLSTNGAAAQRRLGGAELPVPHATARATSSPRGRRRGRCSATRRAGTRPTTMVAELAKCQANNGAAGFTAGYLSGFPESDFDTIEAGRANGNVPYYCLHKTLAGLLDVWRLHRQHPGPRRAAAPRRVGRLAHRPAELQRRCRSCWAPSSAA